MPATKTKSKSRQRKSKQVWSTAERQAWKLPDDINICDWADKSIILPARNSPEPGPYRTSRTPYARAIMDAFTDPEVHEITLKIAAQVCKTQCMYNMIGYIIDQDPSPTMMVMPKIEDRNTVINNRIRPMVEDSPVLRNHLTGKPWDLKKTEFWLDMMTLYYAGANSPSDMSQKSIRYLFFDETNKYPPFSGKESDPFSLAGERTTNFWDAKTISSCTPTTPSGHISRNYKRSNRQKYYLPCPHCGDYQVWIFSQLKIDGDVREPDFIKQHGHVWYECEKCRGKIEESQKEELVAKGQWVPKGQTIDRDGKLHGKPLRSKWHSGFQGGKLISPWVAWRDIMAGWFEANPPSGPIIAKLMNFKNSVLGEDFEETGQTIKLNDLESKRGNFSRGTVPDECLILVASADYHEDNLGNVRIDYEVKGFGYGERNWVITSGSADNFEQLEDIILFSPFPWEDPEKSGDKQDLAVVRLLVDSGFKPDKVYDFCLRHIGIAFPTKGAATRQRTPLVLSNLDRSAYKKKVRYAGLQLIIIDTQFFKDKVSGYAQKEKGTPGSMEFYAEVPQVYFDEFCNEHKVKVTKNGRDEWIWKPRTSGAATHFLDTSVGTAAAAYFLKVHHWRRPGEVRQAAVVARRMAQKNIKSRNNTRRRNRPSGFLDDLPGGDR